MRIYTRLPKLVKNEHGTIAKIAKETRVPRKVVSDLMHNKATSINLAHLSKIGEWLVKEGLVDPNDMPDALFGRDPNRFWPLLADRPRIEFCMGMREDPNHKDLLVIAADSQLQSRLLYGLTDAGGPGRRPRGASVARAQQPSNGPTGNDDTEKPDQPVGPRRSEELVDHRLIQAWDLAGTNHDDVKKRGRAIYKEFQKETREKALVCVGSIKSNAVIELAIARCFHSTKPFSTQDNSATATERTCPFMLLYRQDDVRPESCCGGLQVAMDDDRQAPGIYYELESGQWECCPWTEEQDAAIVFYRFEKTTGNLEMVLGGFSGRATHCLSEYLRNNESDFWPPVYSDDQIHVGAYVVEFDFEGFAKPNSVCEYYPLEDYATTKVTPLATSVLARRVDSYDTRQARKKARKKKKSSSR